MTNDSSRRHVIVVGAGIGGLTAAVALHRQDWDVTVIERASSLDPVGTALGLAPNALHALDAIGLGEDVRRFPRSRATAGSAVPAEPGWSALTLAPWPTASAIRS
jgi:2-polyprenyl-6-methoxyphenol hydroxylase-like FAD-dependent oxidoreductase